MTDKLLVAILQNQFVIMMALSVIVDDKKMSKILFDLAKDGDELVKAAIHELTPQA